MRGSPWIVILQIATWTSFLNWYDVDPSYAQITLLTLQPFPLALLQGNPWVDDFPNYTTSPSFLLPPTPHLIDIKPFASPRGLEVEAYYFCSLPNSSFDLETEIVFFFSRAKFPFI